jgi:hypothetical protein
MAKKSRTGLQSKISHIFAGVPIPKKKRSRSKPSSSKPEPDAIEITQSQDEKILTEELVIQEPSVEQPLPPQPQDDKPLVVETPIEQPMEVEDQSEKHLAPEPLPEESSVKESIVKKPVMEIPVETPLVKEPIVEEPSIPFGSTLDVIEPQESVETQQKPPLSRTLKADVAEKSAVRISRKAPIKSKDKRFGIKPATSPTGQKIKIALIIVLSIVLVILLVVKPFSWSPQNIDGDPGTIPNGSQISIFNNIRGIEVDWPEPPIYNPDELRDPMELSSAQDIFAATQELIVKGITISETKKYALIGIQIVEEGDVIFGVRVVKINPDSVVFEKDGETWIQEIEKE